MNKFLIMLTTLVFILGIVVIHSYGTKQNIKESNMAGNHNNHKLATFAGGCFWCVESDLEKVPGVLEAISGYTGGPETNPTYKEVAYGKTGHVEAVQVMYDPDKTDYKSLLDVFWKNIDPTDPGGQFADRGAHYKTVIFYHDDEQKKLAEESRATLNKSGRFSRPVVTEIKQLQHFYVAEDYHQDYYKKNPVHYKTYRKGSGRDRFIEKNWGRENPNKNVQTNGVSFKLADKESRVKKLTPLQHHVTQKNGTEPPFNNKYWDNRDEGIYVDIVSGEPLFSSKDKFKSGTGWPSFTAPLEKNNIVEKVDNTHFMVRTEVRSTHADSHLGHVFPDGPKPDGLRYCINSASLRFVPKENLKKEGYGDYLDLFSDN